MKDSSSCFWITVGAWVYLSWYTGSRITPTRGIIDLIINACKHGIRSSKTHSCTSQWLFDACVVGFIQVEKYHQRQLGVRQLTGYLHEYVDY